MAPEQGLTGKKIDGTESPSQTNIPNNHLQWKKYSISLIILMKLSFIVGIRCQL